MARLALVVLLATLLGACLAGPDLGEATQAVVGGDGGPDAAVVDAPVGVDASVGVDADLTDAAVDADPTDASADADLTDASAIDADTIDAAVDDAAVTDAPVDSAPDAPDAATPVDGGGGGSPPDGGCSSTCTWYLQNYTPVWIQNDLPTANCEVLRGPAPGLRGREDDVVAAPPFPVAYKTELAGNGFWAPESGYATRAKKMCCHEEEITYYFDGTSNWECQTFGEQPPLWAPTNTYKEYATDLGAARYIRGVANAFDTRYGRAAEGGYGIGMAGRVATMIYWVHQDYHTRGMRRLSVAGFSRGSASAMMFLHALKRLIDSGELPGLSFDTAMLYDPVWATSVGLDVWRIPRNLDDAAQLAAVLEEGGGWGLRGSQVNPRTDPMPGNPGDPAFTLDHSFDFSRGVVTLYANDEYRNAFRPTGLNPTNGDFITYRVLGNHGDAGGGWGPDPQRNWEGLSLNAMHHHTPLRYHVSLDGWMVHPATFRWDYQWFHRFCEYDKPVVYYYYNRSLQVPGFTDIPFHPLYADAMRTRYAETNASAPAWPHKSGHCTLSRSGTDRESRCRTQVGQTPTPWWQYVGWTWRHWRCGEVWEYTRDSSSNALWDRAYDICDERLVQCLAAP